MNRGYFGKNETRALTSVMDMGKICPKSKRSQVGVTLTWLVAFVVIFFIMLVFIGMTSILVTEKKLNKNEIPLVETGFNKIDGQRNLIRFLNSETEFKGQKMIFKDFLSNVEDSKDKEDKFKEIAESFIKESFSLGVEDKDYYRVWIRIYSPNDEIGQYFAIDGNTNYEVSSFLRGGKGGINCDPLEENAVVLSILISINKKIVVCGNIA